MLFTKGFQVPLWLHHKGVDRAMVATVVEGDQARDEITQYEDLRSVGSSEATWHLLAFPISKRYPPVQPLRVHTEDQQQVVFDEGTEEVALETQRETELTAFFKLNEQLQQEGHEAENRSLPKYVDVDMPNFTDMTSLRRPGSKDRRGLRM